jgi:peptidyl-prolyl cis-trans isomerase C
MKMIINISMILIVLLSATVCTAKPKKPVAEPKKAVMEPNKPAAEPKAPTAEPNTVVAVNSIPVLSKVEGKDVNAVVVTVNGKEITEAQIGAMLDPRMQQMAGRIPENMIPQYRQQIRKHVIEQLVVEELLAQKEKQSNIDVNQSELDQGINKQIAEQNLTMDEFKALLKAYSTNFSDYQQNMRKKLMFEKLVEAEIAGKVQKPTDEQAKTYYDENIQQFGKPETIHVKHILIKPADSNDPNQAKAEARAKAQEILEKIKAGADFNDLAKQYSACPSGKDGGDLGIQAKGTFVPEFEKAAYALKPGQISDVVETSFGFHIIKLLEHTDANTASFAAAKDQILQILSGKQKEQLFMEYIRKMKTEADVKYANEEDWLEFKGEKTAGPSRKPEQNQQTSDGNNPKKD